MLELRCECLNLELRIACLTMIDDLVKLVFTTSFAIIRQYSYVSYQIRFLFISGIVERPSSSKPRPPRECQLHEPRNEAANIVHRSHAAHQLSRGLLSSKQGLHLKLCGDPRTKVTPAKTHYPINNQQTRNGCMNARTFKCSKCTRVLPQ